MTVGGKKAPEDFSVLELLNKGGLRLPQMTTAERNNFKVANNALGSGLTIYNKDTKCVEYWNAIRWVSLCEGASQSTLGPVPCTDIKADGSGCDQPFVVTDPDCPNGPFTIAIVAGSQFASLSDVDLVNGSFRISFQANETIDAHTVLVRVTSTCTNMYKEFLFSQNGVVCSGNYSIPTVTATGITLCSGGSTYLSVPSTTANLDKLIWTRNGVEVARGVNNYAVTQPGKYNVSMGAIGCYTNPANEKNITASGTAYAKTLSAIVTNSGVICGTNTVTLTALLSSPETVVWFQDGVERSTSQKGSPNLVLSGDAAVGKWYGIIVDGTSVASSSCLSQPSNSVIVSKSSQTQQVTVNAADALVNGQPLANFANFCKGGSLDLSVANKVTGITYTWYNGANPITVNPFQIPDSQAKILLRLVATDNSGTACAGEVNSTEKDIITAVAPVQPNITGSAVLCGGTSDLTLVPAQPGVYSYTWYKDNVKMSETTATITIASPGSTYSGTVSNASGCSSPMVSKQISTEVSSLPVLSWISKPVSGIYGGNVTVQTGIEFGPATSYTWEATNGAVITGTGASVSIKYPATGADGGTVDIKVTAENVCGKSAPLTLSIPVNNSCPTPSLAPQGSASPSITVGSSASLGVTVTNGVTATLQWYTNTTASTTGGTAISGATAATYQYAPSGSGTAFLYCVVTNGCTGKPTGALLFTVTTAADPATITPGSGTFTGRTTFDVNESNFNAGCGTADARGGVTVKADFNQLSTYSQAYIFTPSGSVSKIRFVYVESLSGAIVSSFSSATSETALNQSSPVIATMIYKTTLSSPQGQTTGLARGRTDANALSVDIYVIYNDKSDGTGVDKKLRLNAKIKDCQFCGAYIAAGVWKTFMCHNLGADTSKDPFTPDLAIGGDYYRWGAKTPIATSYTPAGEINVSIWGEFNSYKTSLSNWGGNQDNSTIKGPMDPCPDGFRVMNVAEVAGLMKMNTFVDVGVLGSTAMYTNAQIGGSRVVGAPLYFQWNGYRSNNRGLLLYRGAQFNYQVNAGYSDASGYTWFNSYTSSRSKDLWTGATNMAVAAASSVRCVEQ
ncbi:hypothetical protein EAH81_27270 [Flavobacterium pectinovorum]|uniref:PKD-like domain-containing protein n=2 Tax=Flavobacterium pectinovorum TaxID=29533 RepID=A0A502DX62_9FLAO|nr:hypothetical protein EAH81_27270 [Flavobacterium pectinovorum]